MSEHATPQEPAPGSAGPSAVTTAQFLFTGVVLVVVAGLMYMAGFRTGKGGEGGPAGGTPGAQQAAAVDVQALLASTPEQVAAGKSLFSVNCASCHGTAGKGDGPAAVALNPKPRDFTSGYWRYGGGVARIVQTITTGSPGTAMAPFPGIPLPDRFALAHYIRTLAPKQEADKPEDLAWLDQFGGGKRDTTGGAAPAAAGAAPGDTIPIARAIALLTEPAAPAVRVAVATPDSAGSPASTASGEGARLFARRCASCHGAAGEGGVRTRMLGSAPYAYVTTRALGGGTPAPDAAGFERLVIRGLPGLMTANGDLTTEQVRALYSYTQSLRARQESAAHARS